jgi:hypothetical protein
MSLLEIGLARPLVQEVKAHTNSWASHGPHQNSPLKPLDPKNPHTPVYWISSLSLSLRNEASSLTSMAWLWNFEGF